MVDQVRVKDNTTRHEYTITRGKYDRSLAKDGTSDVYTLLDKPAVGLDGLALSPKYHRELPPADGYAALTNAQLEDEINLRNTGRAEADLIQPSSTRKDDLVSALQADDTREENR